MKILLYTKYGRKGASSRVRCFNYIERLEQLGTKITVENLWSDEALERKFKSGKYSIVDILQSYAKRLKSLRNISNYDVIWIQKELLPGIPSSIESFFLKKKKEIVFDIDDAEFIKYQKSKNILVKYFLGKKYQAFSRLCSVIVAGNHYLLSTFSNWSSSAEVILLPSVVPINMYPVAPEKTNSENKIIIGWIGSPTTQHYIENILDVIDYLKKTDSRIELQLIGASDSFKKRDYIKIIPWSEATYADKISKFDMGIMPLNGDKWDEGKCSYKAIQYMACGIPVILTPTLANKAVVEEGINGFFAKTHDDWVSAITTLSSDYMLREKMGLKNREKVERSFSIESQLPRLAKALGLM